MEHLLSLAGPAIVLMSAAGLVRPPVLSAFGPRQPHLLREERRLGTALGVIGLVVGAAMCAIWASGVGYA